MADALAVLDTVGVDSAVVVGLSLGGRTLLHLAADHPDRVAGAMFVAPAVDMHDSEPVESAFDEPRRDVRGWDRWNAHYWRADQRGFAEFFFGEVFPEAHSTRQVEEGTRWALETDADALVASQSPGRRVVSGPQRGTPRRGSAAPRSWCTATTTASRPWPTGVRWPTRWALRSRWSSVAATASRRGTPCGSTCGSAGSSRRWAVVRAREPDRVGDLDRDGVNVHYEVFGAGPVTVMMLGCFPVVDGRQWKGQVPYLSRHFRVVTIDPRGNGLSGRPTSPADQSDALNVEDVSAVMDDVGVDAAFLVALCGGARWAMNLAHIAPERVLGVVAIAPSVPLALPEHDVIEHMAHPRWVGRYEEWVDYHSDLMFAEPHSSKHREDMVAWALQTDAETLTVRLHADLDLVDEDEAREALAKLTCPVLVIHGTEDNCQPVERGRAVAEVTGGRLVEVEGAGHVPHGRHPVLVNTLIKEFVDMHAPSTTASTSPAPTPWLFARERKRRVLWVCSPIGLGHVLRDVAIARALRERVPDLEIEWLAQSPVTEVLATHGEIVHPASVELASESAHWESESTTTTCTPSTRSGGWTRSSARTTCSSTTWSARRRTTSGSATSRGRSTTSCTRTRSARSRRTRSSPTSWGSCPSTPSRTRARSSCARTTTPR